MSSSAEAFVTFKCWSRDWWAALLARIERGESVTFMLQHACCSGRTHTERAELMPSREVVIRLKAFPSDGEAMRAWRPWLAAHGADLPPWRDRRVWVFLPAPQPPSAGEPLLQARGAAA
jgi:hypothetical protein